MSDFIGAESLGKALECMKPSEADASMLAESLQPATLRAEILSEHHKQDVYRCVAHNRSPRLSVSLRPVSILLYP